MSNAAQKAFNELNRTLAILGHYGHPWIYFSQPGSGAIVSNRHPKAAPGFTLDVMEREEDYLLRAAVPGIEKDRINASIQNNKLSIKIEAAPESSEEGKFHIKETVTGAAERVLEFPAPLDPEKITADLRNGILELKVPKNESTKVRKIKISAT